MPEDRPDLIQYLQEEVAYYQEKLALAQAALRAVMAPKQQYPVERTPAIIRRPVQKDISYPPEQQPSGIRWAKEARIVFNEVGRGVELNHDEVVAKLVAKGIPADSPQGRNNVTTALARMHGKYLMRVRPGVFRLRVPGELEPQEQKSE